MGKFDLENFPTSNSAKKMLSYVSDGFYDESYVGKWLFQVMGIEYDKALEIVEDLPAQFFPETATWGLMYHEIKWGLPIRENLSYEERRKLIYKKRDYRAPMTPYRMEQYLKDVIGLEVHIEDIHDFGKYGIKPEHPNFFGVYFTGITNPDIKSTISILNKIKQSHTVYGIVIKNEYRTHANVSCSSYTRIGNKIKILAYRPENLITQVGLRIFSVLLYGNRIKIKSK